MLESVLRRIEETKAQGKLLIHEPMARHTTFRVGGPADALFLADSEDAMLSVMAVCRETHTPMTFIGRGSNLIVRDKGIRGLVIAPGEGMARMEREGDILTAGAGASLSALSAEAARWGLSGLEFASGIPGSVGGGVAMNAGAYGGEIKDVLVDARVYMEGEIRTLNLQQMEMGYRSTLPLRAGAPVLSARFRLAPGEREAIFRRMNELNQRRRDKQPVNLPSAGSVFKRPEGYFAGTLIEQAGLKGRRIGDAQVSEKHAGFIVNVGQAKAEDILALIALIQREVKEKFSVSLQTEVRVLGEE